MKKISLLGIVCVIGCVCKCQNFYNGYSAVLPFVQNPTVVTSAPFLSTPTTRTDTMIITGGSLGSSYFGQQRGQDTLHPFVVYYNNTVGAGVKLENCSYMKVIGVGTNHAQLTSGGVPLVITGQANWVQASGFRITNGTSGGIWCKTEAADACIYANAPFPYNNINDYLYPNHMRHIWITDCRIGNADGTGLVGGDGFYLGSTGSQGDRPVPCRGNQLLKPMYMNDVHAIRDSVFHTGRSAIQISGSDSGNNQVINCYVSHVGREWSVTHDSGALFQGAGIRTGYGDNNQTEIGNNTVIGSFLYNYDIETGANVHDNYGDSSGWYTNVQNPQQIQSMTVFALLPNSTVIVRSNQMKWNSSVPSTGISIFGNNNWTNQNVVCNNIGSPVRIFTPPPFVYSTTCNNNDTICHDSTYTIQHDTIKTVTIPEEIRTRDTSILISASIKRNNHKNGSYSIVIKSTYVDSTIYDTISAHDTTFLCGLCTPPHDTTIQVCIITPAFIKPEVKSNLLHEYAFEQRLYDDKIKR